MHYNRAGALKVSWKVWFVLFSLAAAALCTGGLWIGSELPREQAFMTGIFVLAALLWVSEALPLFATSLLVIGLELLLLANPGQWSGLGFETSEQTPSYPSILQRAASPVLILFFGGFLLARAAIKEGVDQAMSALLLRPFGERPQWVLLGIMIVTALFSMWMSNTATTAMMITLTVPLLGQIPEKDPYRRGIVLAVPFAANIGGLGTPIASPPNAVAMGYLNQAGSPIAFVDWMLVADPLMVVMLVIAWQWLWWKYRPASKEMRLSPGTQTISPRGWLVVTTFGVTVIAWLTDRWHGIPSSIVALIPAIVFTATGLLSREDVDRLEWNILILIAGGLALGGGMEMTGLDQTITGLLPVSSGSGALWLITCLVMMTVLMSTFMSNTAAANLLLPIGISAATTMGSAAMGPAPMALAIAFAASMAMILPISTPPNAIAYSRGEFATRDMALGGAVIGIIASVLIVFAIRPVLKLWGIA